MQRSQQVGESPKKSLATWPVTCITEEQVHLTRRDRPFRRESSNPLGWSCVQHGGRSRSKEEDEKEGCYAAG